MNMNTRDNLTQMDQGFQAGRTAVEHMHGDWMRAPVVHPNGGAMAIPKEDLTALAFCTQGFIAELIQCYIDAGSERECIMEDEKLHDELVRVFREWSEEG